MIKLEINVNTLSNILDQVEMNVLKERVEKAGYIITSEEDSGNYVNIKKSMGTEPFYDMLVENITNGNLSLELLVGKVALEKIKQLN